MASSPEPGPSIDSVGIERAAESRGSEIAQRPDPPRLILLAALLAKEVSLRLNPAHLDQPCESVLRSASCRAERVQTETPSGLTLCSLTTQRPARDLGESPNIEAADGADVVVQ